MKIWFKDLFWSVQVKISGPLQIVILHLIYPEYLLFLSNSKKDVFKVKIFWCIKPLLCAYKGKGYIGQLFKT